MKQRCQLSQLAGEKISDDVDEVMGDFMPSEVSSFLDFGGERKSFFLFNRSTSSSPSLSDEQEPSDRRPLSSLSDEPACLKVTELLAHLLTKQKSNSTRKTF
ncbi:hypothetical protein OIU77_010300 [Salix suchowensis]|uniref:Uncharacterized protein n=1 Tax=Salix suchowensis TaxID=1278906 RepID=A0ABQ9A8L0_9ROSI|nr:hypothetical protein OIU77_010300 [Salix suchowensis]